MNGQQDDLAARMTRIKAQQADPLAARMEQIAQRQKPRGYRTPEQIERLNKSDVAAVSDVALGPWETLVGGAAAAGQGRLMGWGDEIAAGSDELSTWAARRGAGFFLPPTSRSCRPFGG